MKNKKWGKEVIWVDYIEGEASVQEMGSWLEKHSGWDCKIIQNLRWVREKIKSADIVSVPENDIYFKKLQNRIMQEIDQQDWELKKQKPTLYKTMLRQFPLYRFGR